MNNQLVYLKGDNEVLKESETSKLNKSLKLKERRNYIINKSHHPKSIKCKEVLECRASMTIQM